MRNSKKITLLALLALATSVAPALAKETTVAMAPDCATADATMMAMAKSMPAVAASGNLDHDFMAMTKNAMKMMTEATKLEMACGKDPHAREMAASISKQNKDVLHTLMIGGGATH